MTKKLIADLLANVRSHNMGNSYKAATGWEKPYEHNCEICGNKWAPGKREDHKPTCLIARAYKAIGQRPRVIPLRPL